MDETSQRPLWLLLLFGLPTSNASKRVEVWRRLKKIGALALKSSGHVLPLTAENEEHFQWLATEIRKVGGEATVAQVLTLTGVPAAELANRFVAERAEEYAAV